MIHNHPIAETRADWVAYRNIQGVHHVLHRGTEAECYELALYSVNPPLYVAYRPKPIDLSARLDAIAAERKSA